MQLCAEALGNLFLRLQQVGKRHLIEQLAHPLFEGLPDHPQRAAVAMNASARCIRAGMALTKTGILEERLAQGSHHFTQPNLDGRPNQHDLLD